MSSKEEITVLGAGLAGSLLSTMLVKDGYTTQILEKRADPRTTKIPEGRSINLALSHRGIQALKAAETLDRIKDQLIPMYGRMIHDEKGNQTYLSYGKEEQHINSVSRNDLNIALINEAEENGANFHFDAKINKVDLVENQVTYSSNSKEIHTHCPVLIGADGAFSALRTEMQKLDRFDYSQTYLGHGYKELAMPPRNGDFAMEPDFLHIWPRKDFMLIALPNPDKTFTCTLFLQFEGDPGFDGLDDAGTISSFFERYFPDVIDLIPDLLDQFRENPTSSLVTVRCGPWNRGKSLILGDAAHAIVPFYGQGMNAAFEDCRVFHEMLQSANNDWSLLFDKFFEARKENADAIADLAMYNFLEMRDHVADEEFRVKKAVDEELHEKFKDQWVPLYSMVTFSDIPYAVALKKGRNQATILSNALKEGYLDDHNRLLAEYESLNSKG